MAEHLKDESELYLQAMLYLLNDPSLDKAAFESRLADDSRLGEILAESVSLVQALNSLNANSQSFVCVPANEVKEAAITYALQPKRARWLTLASIAASLAFVSYIGWKSFQAESPQVKEITSLSKMKTPRLNGRASLTSEIAELRNVVWAWGELRTTSRDDHIAQHSGSSDSEVVLAVCDSLVDNDIPEWLVLATAAVIEQGGGVDTPLEQVETRTLIQ